MSTLKIWGRGFQSISMVQVTRVVGKFCSGKAADKNFVELWILRAASSMLHECKAQCYSTGKENDFDLQRTLQQFIILTDVPLCKPETMREIDFPFQLKGKFNWFRYLVVLLKSNGKWNFEIGCQLDDSLTL